ncbi:MAG: 5-bromo-4-chloroindolyl phosphate hydrolysis family protein [Parasporobacterium sp.]|nr:5-bromo-4-chloroindolyl phosphate hydrolysis family protein [Parasporobacterium sp.]
MITVLIIVAAAVVLFGVGAFVLARVSGRNKAKVLPEPGKPELTLEQKDVIRSSQSELVSIRMIFSRITNSDIGRRGAQICDEIDRILKALKDKPDNVRSSSQLFSYYIPTLKNVAERYQNMESGNALDTPQIPEKVMLYLDDMNSAMGNMYAGLFDKDKLKVEVDMEAMTMALRRDGLLPDTDEPILKPELKL